MHANVLPFPESEPAVPAPSLRPAPRIAYESPLTTVYHGRAEDVLPLLRTESVDLVATDPPYGVGWQSGRRKEAFERIANDLPTDRDLVKQIIEQCVRVVAQQRHVYAFGPVDVFDGLKVSDVVQMVWDKGTMGSGDMTSAWGPSHELLNMTVSKHRHAGKTGLSVLPTRLRKGTVLRYNRPTGKAVRSPSEKPVGLMREIIESSSRQGDTVLDPFAGSGSTGVAAILSGRRAILVECVPQWVAMTIERVQAAEKIAAEIGAC